MQKPLTQPALQPLRSYIRPLVINALRAAGYTFADKYIAIYHDPPTFDSHWTCLVYVYGQVERSGVWYDLDGWGEVDKIVGKPKWRDGRVDIRFHSDPFGQKYELDVARLKVRASG